MLSFLSGNKKSKRGRSLYETAEKIYPKAIKGRFNTLRALAVWSLLAIYYFIPWFTWDDRQAVLFDIQNRQFHILGLTFWPQDLIFFALILIALVLALFLFTAVGGRLWCGYACPQTVWTEIFIWIERRIEGSRNEQMKLAKAPWSLHKLRVKSAKHSVWIVFALFTGFTFVGYFSPIQELTTSVVENTLGNWELFWILFYSAATYINAGKLREQICIYMCPYARFQSVMFDKDTLIVTYDEARGEPRGKRKVSEAPSVLYKDAAIPITQVDDEQTQDKTQLGDCIDCKQCVHVCPTGIDIRDGLQYACIACSACIDACDEVMDKIGYPRGLVKYATEHEMTGNKTHVLRPRVLIYTTILILLLVGISIGVASRVPVDLDVIRDRKQLYSEVADNQIENLYILKVMNLDRVTHQYKITVEGINGARIELDEKAITIDSGKMAQLPVRVISDKNELKSPNQDISFVLTSTDDNSISKTVVSRFMAPVEMFFNR
ncbi:MAG: cytochrome c oxidase accessory protein CcoG [Pseudomonadota bacterium]